MSVGLTDGDDAFEIAFAEGVTALSAAPIAAINATAIKVHVLLQLVKDDSNARTTRPTRCPMGSREVLLRR
ncbi:MAG: hypothetical protein ABSA92_02525 [Candidatus Bathyarchaeia archaeon]|jgi:hypothetical protein